MSKKSVIKYSLISAIGFGVGYLIGWFWDNIKAAIKKVLGFK